MIRKVKMGPGSNWTLWFTGRDPVNTDPLPCSLAGAGEVDVAVTAAGITSNAVTIVIE